MSWLASLRRRLRVRIVHGTSAGFGPGDRLFINIPGHMTEEASRALWEALKSNFPDTPFQLLIGRDFPVTVVQCAGCNCACNSSNNASNERGREELTNVSSGASAACPEAVGGDNAPSLVVFSVDVPPKPLGDAFVPGSHLEDSRVVWGEKEGSTHE